MIVRFIFEKNSLIRKSFFALLLKYYFFSYRIRLLMNTQIADTPTNVYTIIAILLSVYTVVSTPAVSTLLVIISGKTVVIRLRLNQPTNARLRPPITKRIKKIQ